MNFPVSHTLEGLKHTFLRPLAAHLNALISRPWGQDINARFVISIKIEVLPLLLLFLPRNRSCDQTTGGTKTIQETKFDCRESVTYLGAETGTKTSAWSLKKER
jgi:hypothetical protein